MQLLGGIYFRAKRYDEAKNSLSQSIEVSYGFSRMITETSKMYLAGVYLEKGNVDSALVCIRNTHKHVAQMSRNSAFAMASRIYRKVGLLDYALMFAKKLSESKYPYNKQTRILHESSKKRKVLIKI